MSDTMTVFRTVCRRQSKVTYGFLVHGAGLSIPACPVYFVV